MMSTLGTDLQVRFEISLKNVLPTALALLPQTFGANTLFWIWFNLAFLPLKPGHVFPSAPRPQNFPCSATQLRHWSIQRLRSRCFGFCATFPDQEAALALLASVPGVVRMPCKYCKCPIELFCQDQARELVREGHPSQRQSGLCLAAGAVRPAACRTNGEDDRLLASVPPGA